MKTNSSLLYLGKLLLSSSAFILGAVIGGMIVPLLGLQLPPMPEGVDNGRAFLILILESPLLVLPLILIGRGLGGGILSRGAVFALFTWAVYTLNTAIESLAVRIPHTIEILADSFVHAGLLVVLLAKRSLT